MSVMITFFRRKPNFDDNIQTDLMFPIYLSFSCGLTSYIQIYKFTRYKLIIWIQSLNFQTRDISFLSEFSRLHLRQRVYIWREMKSLAHPFANLF